MEEEEEEYGKEEEEEYEKEEVVRATIPIIFGCNFLLALKTSFQFGSCPKWC